MVELGEFLKPSLEVVANKTQRNHVLPCRTTHRDGEREKMSLVLQHRGVFLALSDSHHESLLEYSA